MKVKEMIQTESFNLRYYFQTLTKLLSEPGAFFRQMPSKTHWTRPFGFLMVSSLFFAAASIIASMSTSPLLMGVIYLINAVGMTFIAAIIGFIVISMFMGKRVDFTKFFSIYAFASGVALLSSWMPYFLVITEPWKWWLTYIGIKNVCHVSGRQSFMIIVVSIALLLLFFWTLLPFMIR
jgi:hypothetical protein